MDSALAYVLKTFGITREHLFTKKQTREYTDPRALLYALIYEGNKYATRKLILERYNYTVSLSSISEGLNKAKRYFQKEIDLYRRDQRLR